MFTKGKMHFIIKFYIFQDRLFHFCTLLSLDMPSHCNKTYFPSVSDIICKECSIELWSFSLCTLFKLLILVHKVLTFSAVFTSKKRWQGSFVLITMNHWHGLLSLNVKLHSEGLNNIRCNATLCNLCNNLVKTASLNIFIPDSAESLKWESISPSLNNLSS